MVSDGREEVVCREKRKKKMKRKRRAGGGKLYSLGFAATLVDQLALMAWGRWKTFAGWAGSWLPWAGQVWWVLEGSGRVQVQVRRDFVGDGISILSLG